MRALTDKQRRQSLVLIVVFLTAAIALLLAGLALDSDPLLGATSGPIGGALGLTLRMLLDERSRARA